MHILFSLGLVLLGAWFSGKIIKLINLPLVTAYIIFGIIAGPFVMNFVHGDLINVSPLISSVGLGLIAFNIGQNFIWSDIKRMGKMVLLISVFEAMSAYFLVMFAARFLLSMAWAPAMCLGALASATAPAATMMVIKEYRASGLFTSTLLGIVAFDDAVCLLIISVSLAMVNTMAVMGGGNAAVGHALLFSLGSIGGALLTGIILTFLIKKIAPFIITRENLLIFMLAFLLIGIGVSEMLKIPLLLTCMVMGGVLANISHETKFFDVLHEVDAPVYLLFFVFSGANLKISTITSVGAIAAVYFIARIAGKFAGSYIGSVLSHAPARIRKYMWLGLVPQAGVALGAALMVRDRLPQYGEMVFTTIVTTTVVYELVGPVCTRIALRKAGEIS
ncbi:MAG: cation/H(+) antiporter [Elusimicrobia bacterium CG03_land_8_20_14_0_80_50_18]|nr:MAG: cation/H(+) antiporter [Elusimicrobia bacterium CG03_land_8_20_14_0_80_50_18]PIX16660.1 MAG: cation/H(+) antiporter [Elusimicrobia bacterium CG_4_8_14_3_um_filter_50_9]